MADLQSVSEPESTIESEVKSEDISTPAPHNNDVSELQKSLNLEPRTIVLAKVKGYRPWPAMVLQESILPENIQKMKPKSVRLAKKPKTPVIIVPVRFFSDDTYIWIKSCDLKVLPSAEIEQFLAKRANSKKHDLLIDAYKLAKDPPDMLEFNYWGSLGVPQFPSEEDEPPQKKLKLSIKLKNPKKKASTPPATKKKNGVKEVINYAEYSEEDSTDDDLSLGFDSDWGLEEDQTDYENGNFIFEDKKEQEEFELSFPKAADLNDTTIYFHDKFDDIHMKVAPLLLLDEGDEGKVLTELKRLGKLVALAETPLVLFTKSTLFRTLLLSVHKPPEHFPHKNVRAAIVQIFKSIDLEACEITLEDLVVPDSTRDATPAEAEEIDEAANSA